MKIKRFVIITFVSLLTLSVCSLSLMAYYTKSSGTSILSDEEKSRMIEERKEQRRKYGGMTTEEELLAKGEYSMLEEIENAKKEANATKEGREEQKNVEELLSYYNELDYENEKAVFTLLKDSEKYPNGYDKERFLKDEDYYLECICEVCRMFCQEESNLTSDEKNQIKDYLDTAYNDIVHWYPQSEKSKETYELIEEALDMEYVIRMVTEKPLTFRGFKRSEVK